MLPAKQTSMNATEEMRRFALGTDSKPNRKFGWIIENSLVWGGAAVVLLCWMATGALFHFNNDWQFAIIMPVLVMLMMAWLTVLLNQKSQNRASAALHLKLDQLTRAAEAVHHAIAELEKLSRAEYCRLGTGSEDWTPQLGEDGHRPSPSPSSASIGRNHSQHRSGTNGSSHRGAGAHQIKPSTKA